MLRLVADENFNGDVVRGLFRRFPTLDLVRAQDEVISEADDSDVLEWAEQQNRIVLTHDKRTFPDHVFARLRRGQRHAGVFIVRNRITVGRAIAELSFAIECSDMPDWENRLQWFPL